MQLLNYFNHIFWVISKAVSLKVYAALSIKAVSGFRVKFEFIEEGIICHYLLI